MLLCPVSAPSFIKELDANAKNWMMKSEMNPFDDIDGNQLDRVLCNGE